MSTVVEEPTTIDLPTAPDKEAERRELLLKAADAIEQRGWRQKVYCDEKNRMCFVGAVGFSVYGSETIFHDPALGDEFDDMMEALPHLLGVDLSHVYAWNDADGRTADGVARVMREMANGKTFYEAAGLPPWTPDE